MFPRSESEVITPSSMLDMLPVPRSSSEVIKPSEVFLELMMLDPLKQDVSRQATANSIGLSGSFAVAAPQAQNGRIAAATTPCLQLSHGVMAPIQPTSSYGGHFAGGPTYSYPSAQDGPGSFILRRGDEGPVSPVQRALAQPCPAPFAFPSFPQHPSHIPTPPHLLQRQQLPTAPAAAHQLMSQQHPQVQAQFAAAPRPPILARVISEGMPSRVLPEAMPARVLPEASPVSAHVRAASLAVPAAPQMQQQAISPVSRPLQAPAFNVPAAATARAQPASMAVPANLQMQQQATSLMLRPSAFGAYAGAPASVKLPPGHQLGDALGMSQAPVPQRYHSFNTFNPGMQSQGHPGMQLPGQSLSMPMARQSAFGSQPVTMGTSAIAPAMLGMSPMQRPRQNPPLAIAAAPWWGAGQSMPSSVAMPSAQPYQARHAMPQAQSPMQTNRQSPMQTNRDFGMQAMYASPMSTPMSFQPRSPQTQMDAGFAMQAAHLAASKFPLPPGF